MASTYRVVPFVASIGINEGAAQAAAQLEALIQSQGREGWDFVRLESITTFVAGNNGCFGLGAVPPRTTSYSIAVFRR